MGRAALNLGTLPLLALLAFPACAQEGPAGPCSPYRATDGDIPSELPGCATRLRPAPGSLADELEFRRARKGADAADGTVPDDDAPQPVPRRRRTGRSGSR